MPENQSVLDKAIINILRKTEITERSIDFLYYPILKKEISLLDCELFSLNDSEQNRVYDIYTQSQVFMDEGKITEAIELLTSVQTFVKEPLASNYYNLGCAYYRIDQFNNAEKAFKKSIEIAPDLKDAHHSLAHIYLKSNRLEESLTELQRINKEWPVFENILFDLGTAYVLSQDYKNGVKYLWKELRNDPYNGLAYNNLGFTYNELGMFKESIECLEKVINMSSNFGKPYLNLAMSFLKSGNPDAAIMYLKNLIFIHSTNRWAHFALGLVYKMQGRFFEAVESYLNAIKINYNFAEAHLHLSLCYLDKGIANNNNELLDDALHEISMFISLRLGDGRGYLIKGILYQKKQKNAEALRSYERAIKCFSNINSTSADYLHAFILQSEILLSENNHEQLQKVIDKAIKVFPLDPYLKQLKA
ncbi:MAG: tetratricopeptide repeat protein [Candidatus Firestonebacteria bacterium]|nr:tetratricopeptide repeat protein [Candidatus Firestonebacteria bacterium]